MSRLSVLGIAGPRRPGHQRLRGSSTPIPRTSFRHQFTWPGIKMETSLGFKIQAELAEETFCLKKIAEERTVSLSKISLSRRIEDKMVLNLDTGEMTFFVKSFYKDGERNARSSKKFLVAEPPIILDTDVEELTFSTDSIYEEKEKTACWSKKFSDAEPPVQELKMFTANLKRIINISKNRRELLEEQPTLAKGLNAAKRLHKNLSNILYSIPS